MNIAAYFLPRQLTSFFKLISVYFIVSRMRHIKSGINVAHYWMVWLNNSWLYTPQRFWLSGIRSILYICLTMACVARQEHNVEATLFRAHSITSVNGCQNGSSEVRLLNIRTSYNQGVKSQFLNCSNVK